MSNFTESQIRDLAMLVRQATELGNKPTLTKAEQRQHSNLLTKISLVKQGVNLSDLDRAEVNEVAERNGLPQDHEPRSLTPETRKIAAGFKRFFESRDSYTGHPGVAALMSGNMGSFVPVEFYYGVFDAMKEVDPLLSEDDVTYIETVKGNPMQVPFYSDTENVAQVVGEGSDQSGNETDIHQPGAAVVGGYSFRSPMWRVSVEAFQDVMTVGGVAPLFKKFITDRTARGVSQKLLSGSGSGQPLGLLTALAALGVDPIVAVGSSVNTGGTETGANSIGSTDVAKLVYAVDESYRKSPKCCFLMNDNTKTTLASINDKYGRPLIQWQGSAAFLLGYPVKTSPSMPNIGAASNPVIFGDLSYWMTRCVMAGTKIQIFREAVGLIEKGEVGLRFFTRYDGAVLWNDTSSPCPFAILQNHS